MDLVLLVAVQRHLDPLHHVHNNMHVVAETRGRSLSLLLYLYLSLAPSFDQSPTIGIIVPIDFTGRTYYIASMHMPIPAVIRLLLV